MSSLSGQIIKGYEFYNAIGTGGFGEVFRAHQPVVERDVAVKVILPQYASQPDFIRRFEMEAQVIARLEHPYIVPLYDYWRVPEGAYLVMRFLRGGNLSDLLRDRRLGIDEILRLVDQVASALESAHRRGVVHRDIKPANILLDDEGNAYLSDFGIAKIVGRDTRTRGDGVTGSLKYIAPEQIRGANVTVQTDIYQLGVVVYEMLSGQHPFGEASISELLYKHLEEALPDITLAEPSLPSWVNSIIQQATAKDPAARYGDAVSLARDLRRALTESAPADALPRAVDMTEPVEVASPYKGLRSFEEADAHDFFGRERLVEQLLARLNEPDARFGRFLAVVGPSGSGKSSAVRAGLLPALRRGALPGSEQWFIADFEPGSTPLKNLEAALLSVATRSAPLLYEQLSANPRGLLWAAETVLASNNSDLLLVVDQFEELFTQLDDEAARNHFLDLLRHAVIEPQSRVRVIVTLRADFTDRPLQYATFGELIQHRTEFILPLSPEEIERAIVAPAERVGLIAEPEMVASVVADVRGEPGALPLLQYALTEAFERRQGSILTLSAYQASGRVFGAVARRADDVYQSLDADQQAIARQLFLRLVSLGEGTEDTRRRVRLTELHSLVSDPANLRAVLDAFGRHRLLTFDRDLDTREPTVEVAHEALIREWGQLRAWLDANREDIRIQRRLAAAASEWINAGRDASFLATGTRLAYFTNWLAETNLSLAQEERDFIDASLAELHQQQALERARLERERRQARSLAQARIIAVLILVLLAGVFAVSQAANAEQLEAQAAIAQTQAARAVAAQALSERRALEARSLAMAAAARDALHRDQIEAVALGTWANQVDDPPALAQQVLSEVAYLPGARRVFLGQLAYAESTMNDAAFSPDGAMALSASDDGTLALWDLDQEMVVRTLGRHTGAVYDVDYLPPDGRTALSASADGTVIMWDIETLEAVAILAGHDGPVNAVAASPDGTLALSAGDDGTLILWDLGAASALGTWAGHNAPVRAVAFAPDGATALSGAADGALIQWDVAGGELLRTLSGHSAAVNDVAFSPDGLRALSASDDATVRLWDMATGETARTLVGHSVPLHSVVFSPDGTHALSGSADGAVILWDIETADTLDFIGHAGPVNGVSFNSDGTRALSASEDRSLILWNIAEGEEETTLERDIENLNAVAISPDGQMALAASDDGTLMLWHIATGEPLGLLVGHTAGVDGVAFSPDGRTVMTASEDGRLFLWDVATRQVLDELVDHTEGLNTIAFTPDGRLALTATEDGLVLVWDVETRELLHRLRVVEDDGVDAVAVSPDGATALSGGEDGSIILWNLATGEQRMKFSEQGAGIDAIAFSPDGKTALSAGEDGIRLWDVATGQPVRSFTDHTGSVNNILFLPDGQRALSGAEDETLILWDITTGEPLHIFHGHDAELDGVALGPDGRTAISASEDGVLILWELDAGHIVRRLAGHEDSVDGLALSADGNRLLTASDDQTLRLWDLTTGETLRTMPGHTDQLNDVTLSPDGRLAASVSHDQTIILWDVTTGEQVHALRGHEGAVESVAFSPDGRRLLSASNDETLILWDVETGEALHTFDRHTDTVEDVAFSPDGRTALSASQDETLILWDVETGDVLRVLVHHTEEVKAVAFGPDGHTALSGADDDTLILWDVTTGRPIRIFVGHLDEINALALSPDGRFALSGSDDKTMILWDVETGEAVRTFSGHTDGVSSVAFGADGLTALSGSGDGTVIVWRIDSDDELLAWTREHRYVRDLTCDERVQFQFEPLCDGGTPPATQVQASAAEF